MSEWDTYIWSNFLKIFDKSSLIPEALKTEHADSIKKGNFSVTTTSILRILSVFPMSNLKNCTLDPWLSMLWSKAIEFLFDSTL